MKKFTGDKKPAVKKVEKEDALERMWGNTTFIDSTDYGKKNKKGRSFDEIMLDPAVKPDDNKK